MRFLNAALCATAIYTVPTLGSVIRTPSQYTGTKIIRIPTGGQVQTDQLLNMIDTLGIPTWTDVHIPYSHMDVQVSKDCLSEFRNALRKINPELNSQLTVIHEDLAVSLAKEAEGMNTLYRRGPEGLANDEWFNSYHVYTDHLQFLQDLASTFPNNAKVVTSDNSYEGRPITGINIFGSSGSGAKPAVIFHGTVHAREWISTMVTEQIAYSLLSNYTTSPTIKSYVDKYDFYIFPVVNPDGFVYTQTDPDNRFWRKNRQPPPSNSSCYGRDINRNWAWQWGTGGSSPDPCEEDYHGISAGDSPEFKGLSVFLDARANSDAGAILYMDFHAKGLLFMSPYGYSNTEIAPDRAEHRKMEQGFAAAFKAPYNNTLTIGPIYQTIYQASGTSVDYAYGHSKIKYSFAIELRGAMSLSGFVLPPDEIRPSGIEVYEGVKYLLENMVAEEANSSNSGMKLFISWVHVAFLLILPAWMC
ncbi:extracellular matrix protein 14 [Rhizoctonia solani]|uniref:Extracellular matrix protein 14 n=1 Tax=Rhizoctonia solani TaxID=456999 RepID=A0A8H8P2H6_9AGAM|nr:extracellular matrix protein 14 [Rhizoctonia solani]QRW22457.1 extracellular matrix protein 14 [Rhizoctonia solani]